ncbi:Ig-like domain-containing protein [Nocardia sp. NPDC004151]|uniref:Ig-like domain-containing protein n=1 Tax=Nocardia sp. NPDC004151 TaxID=3364304 RepID=UPI003673F367
MTHATARAAVGAAATVALGAVTLLGSAAAGAAPTTINWDNGSSHYTRTVSNTTPQVGEKITVSTKIERTGSGDEKINWFKDFHDACLTYVTNSAKLTDTSGEHPVEPFLEITSDFIAADFMATSYQVVAKPGNVSSPVFSAQYTVGADCEQDVELDSGIEYLSSAGKATFTDKGPSITVTKKTATSSTTTLAPVTGAVAGKAVTLTATVAPAQAGGSITFKDGGTVIGTGQVGSTGKATVQWTPATAGQHTVTAEYSGSNGTSGSQATASVTVASSGGTGGTGGTGSADSILGSLGSLLGGTGSSQ